MKKYFPYLLIIAAVLGLFIAWNDKRLNWDDTASSIFLILSATVFISFITGRKPWLIALAIGIWLPLFNLMPILDLSFFLILIPAFTGAYFGYFFRRFVFFKTET